MAQTLKLTNFDSLNVISQTQLSSPAIPTATSISVVNTDGFSNNGFMLVGTIGYQTSELRQATTISSATIIPLSASIKLNHNQYEAVYELFGDELRIYRAPDVDGSQPADVSFSLLATIPLDPANFLTMYTDSSGGGGYWYKYTHYNSFTNAETAIASSVASRGTFTSAYCSLDDIREEAGFSNSPYISDDQIDKKRQAAQDTINGQLDEFYDTPLQPPIPDNLRQICVLLAAGYLRQAQYSQISDPQVNGQAKIKWAEGELNKLSMKERVLVNKEGQSLDNPGASGGVEGWPNATTSTTAGCLGGAPRVFRMSDIQGQPYTVDPSGNPVGNLYYGRQW